MIKKFVKISLGRKISFMVLLMVAFSTASIGVYSYYTIRSNSIDQTAESAQSTAKMIAHRINSDPDSFVNVMSSHIKDDYWQQIKKYLDETKEITQAEYIYIFYNTEKGPIYYAEGEKVGDIPEDLGDLGQLENHDAFAEEAYKTLSTGTPSTTDIYNSEGFGYMTSGFAPVFNNSGKPIAVVGVDTGIDSVLAAASRLGERVLIVAIALCVIFMLCAIWYINRVLRLPLNLLTDAAIRIAEGDIHIDIAKFKKSNDEIGALSSALIGISDTLCSVVNDMSHMSCVHTSGEYEYKMDETKYNGAYRDVVNGVNSMTFIYVDIFTELLETLERIGNGTFNPNIKKYPGKLSYGNEIVYELCDKLTMVNNEIILLADTARNGDLSIRANSSGFEGNWANILSNLNNLIEAMVTPLNEVTDILSDMVAGKLEKKMEGSYSGDFAKIQTAINGTTGTLSEYICDIAEALKKFSMHDLNIHVDREFKGDFAVIKDSINKLTNEFNGIFYKTVDVSKGVLKSSRQLADSSMHLSQSISEQTAAMTDALNNIEICRVQTMQDGETAGKVLTISSQSKNDIDITNSEMKNLLSAMESIRSASANISSIIKVIDDIAFQTNLLALNASVEAARAGQHGSGFAVVANEVRNLATRCQTAASETTDLIGEMTNRIKNGAELADTSATLLENMIGGIHQISDLMHVIEESGEIQANAFTKASSLLHNISGAIQGTSAMSEESSSISEEMYAQAESLQNMVSIFKLRPNKR